ncbi:DUF3168 domain-containing protein [Acuticoccus sp. M5D2P5]|uniref:DUF3168 domain-containing protein n=1 Tax=Acuticoccus kalidii TaxID=2910977 RepID=UPI001F1CD63F|nr:DUF3168 domain-containing protein [Acuticoccus kalidii]MCF3933299.1 DUF3168 domain-containing protein [Acuticoccus kalidii]
MSLELAFQRAVVNVLRSDPAVSDLVGDRVLDDVPLSFPTPYVHVGEFQTIDEDVGCGELLEAFVDIHVWTDAVGLVACHAIVAAVRAALREADLALAPDIAPGGKVHVFQHRTSRVMRDSNPRLSHGIINFRAILGGEY